MSVMGSRTGVFGIATRLLTGRSEVHLFVRERDAFFSFMIFCLLQSVQTGSGPHTVSSVGTGVLSRGYSGRDVKLTTHFHLIPWLRMSGTVAHLTLYTFMAWTGRTLPFTKSIVTWWSFSLVSNADTFYTSFK
jgi:hypothetical protein